MDSICIAGSNLPTNITWNLRLPKFPTSSSLGSVSLSGSWYIHIGMPLTSYTLPRITTILGVIRVLIDSHVIELPTLNPLKQKRWNPSSFSSASPWSMDSKTYENRYSLIKEKPSPTLPSWEFGLPLSQHSRKCQILLHPLGLRLSNYCWEKFSLVQTQWHQDLFVKNFARPLLNPLQRFHFHFKTVVFVIGINFHRNFPTLQRQKPLLVQYLLINGCYAEFASLFLHTHFTHCWDAATQSVGVGISFPPFRFASRFCTETRDSSHSQLGSLRPSFRAIVTFSLCHCANFVVLHPLLGG